MTEIKLIPLLPDDFKAGHSLVYFSNTYKKIICDRNNGNVAPENMEISKCNYSTFDDDIDQVYKLQVFDEVKGLSIIDTTLWPFITNRYLWDELLNGVKLS